ncbi:l-allo-threonine aldolase [Hypoxylon rubiginosum]|uniref:L-allo-threonine aldolase n=1 Tax=Hypoxylon rubiginosum TaxID=110542 RepID=A0ACC0CKQ7_9PEZI|nr:l-allo-threonine aldolase [Hypoxylon rubiginosum]
MFAPFQHAHLDHSHRRASRISPVNPDDVEGSNSNTRADRDDNEAVVVGSTAWHTRGSAQFDFRSDFVTTPNAAMLKAIVNTTLCDDETMEDPTTNDFQEYMAGLTGHEDALLVLSGTMGNQVALRTALASPPYSILCDSRSHILRMEAGGAATLCGALIQGVVPSNGHHLTLADVKKHIALRDDIYDCPTRVISLENTLSGTVMPIRDIYEISEFARRQSPPIHMHLDGARLWEAVEANCGGPGRLVMHARRFDSVTLCFSKGLGAPLGSIIVGSKAFIKRARVMRKLLGGGMRQAGVIAAPARAAVDQIFLGGLLRNAQRVAKFISSQWVMKGGKLAQPTETNMVWLDLEAAGISGESFADIMEDAGLRAFRGRLEGRIVVHYQICGEAVYALLGVFKNILGAEDEKDLEDLGGKEEPWRGISPPVLW